MKKYEKPILLDLTKEIFTLGANCVNGSVASGLGGQIGCQNGGDANGAGGPGGSSCVNGGIPQQGCGTGTNYTCGGGGSFVAPAPRRFFDLH